MGTSLGPWVCNRRVNSKVTSRPPAAASLQGPRGCREPGTGGLGDQFYRAWTRGRQVEPAGEGGQNPAVSRPKAVGGFLLLLSIREKRGRTFIFS